MRMLLAIFFPPGYFFAAGRPLAGVIHLVLWLLSIALLFTFIFTLVGVFLWFVQAALAIWDLRKRLVEEQATVMAQKMAQAMASTNQPT